MSDIKKIVRIGVLGGISPEATGMFYNKLIATLQKRGLIKQNSDFPQIIINSVPAKELLKDSHPEEDLLLYRLGLKELDEQKVDFIVMVCNTIHYYFEDLQKEIKTPILDLREEVKDFVKKENISSLIVLGTPMTAKKELYKFENLNAVKPSQEELTIAADTIYNFHIGNNQDVQKGKLKKIAKKYTDQGNKILLACTEISKMLNGEKTPKEERANYIDTVDILINSTVERFLSLKQ